MAKIPVVFTFDKRIYSGASVAIKSLVNSASQDTIYDINILHYDIELEYQKELTALLKNTNHTINFRFVDPKIFSGLKKSKNSWNEIVYFRLIIPEIVKSYDKIIYSDVDVFFKQDLKELYDLDLENCEIGAVRAEKNTPDTICHKYFKENKNEYIFWSGLLVLNAKKLREEKYFEKFIQTAKKFNDELKFFDLDVINLTCKNIFPLPLKYCLLEAFFEFDDVEKVRDYAYLKEIYSKSEIEKAKKSPAIIHFAGELGKPWHRKNPPEYYQNIVNNLPKKLKKQTFRTFRKKLFSKI